MDWEMTTVCLENIWPFTTTGEVQTEMFPGFEDKYIYGRNPTNPIIANYRNLHKRDTDYLGGYLTFVWSHRQCCGISAVMQEGIGSSLKENLTQAGPWWAGMYMQGETIPRESNHVRLSKDLKDPWGIPQLVTSIDYDENADKMVVDFMNQSSEMLEKAGCKNIHSTRYQTGAGTGYPRDGRLPYGPRSEGFLTQ